MKISDGITFFSISIKKVGKIVFENVWEPCVNMTKLRLEKVYYPGYLYKLIQRSFVFVAEVDT